MRKTFFILILSLFSIALFATDVSGSQSGTWSLANSPYHLVGDVEVPEGSTLQIEAGVTVIAMGNFRLSAQGTISAIGTPADSIRFESGMADPAALWKGIRITNTTQASTFTHIYVEKADMGVNCQDSPATISHSRFNLNKKGIRLYGMGNPNPPLMEVHNCIVEYSSENGILVHQHSNSHIHDNEIRYNGTGTRYYGAIQLSNQSAGGSCSPEISNNHIHHNFKQGITAWDLTGSGTAIAPNIHNNVIEYNLTGIYLLHSSGCLAQNIIRHNFIAGDTNSGAGVMIGGTNSQPYLLGNEIHGNYCGLYLGENTKPVLGDLASNHAWASGGNQIYNNIDGSNIPHSIFCFSYTDATIVIKAENNYWGTNDPAQIDIGITDQLDDPSLPLVDYDPWLANPPSSTRISGTVTDPLNLASTQSCHLLIVGASSGVHRHHYSVELGEAFNLEFEIDESFYVIANTTYHGGWSALAAAGSLTEPTVFEPDMEHQTGDIVFDANQNTESKCYVGEPIQSGGRYIYPVYYKYFVFRYGSMDWFYDEGDYRYIYATTYLDENGEASTETIYPDNSIYSKINNLQPYDTWTRADIEGDNYDGTTSFTYLVLEDGMAADRVSIPVLLQVDDATGRIVSRSEFDHNGQVYTCSFGEDGHALYQVHCTAEAFNIPLQTGLEVVYHNSRCVETLTDNLYYDHARYIEDQTLNLYWLPPAMDFVHEWTHYNIYADDVMVASTDGFTPFISLTDPPQGAMYTVKASDGTAEGESGTALWIPTVSSDDPIMPPVTLSIYPNPFSDGRINIKLDDPRKQSGSFSVYNLRGQKVYTQDFAKDEGAELFWNGKDQKDRNCGSGIYLLKVNLRDGRSFTKRMVKCK